jgi:cytochrome c-type biogenesis protein CcmH
VNAVAAGLAWVLLACPASSASAPPDAAVLQERAHRVDQALIAPCCFMQTLANHSSPKADELKSEVRALLRAGLSEGEVVQHFVDKYGERILAAPRAEGFNLLAYLMPPFFVLCGLGIYATWVRAHRAAPSATLPPRDRSAAVQDNHLLERMRAELAAFD